MVFDAHERAFAFFKGAQRPGRAAPVGGREINHHLQVEGTATKYHPRGWLWDGMMSAAKTTDLRSRQLESEKITINIGFVDLGNIDLLVREGFYSNRTDLIRTAIRNQLERHGDAIRHSVLRHRFDIGLRRYSAADLEAVRAAGEKLHIQVLGLVVIAPDVSPELARDTIASISVLGALQASPAVKSALDGRID